MTRGASRPRPGIGLARRAAALGLLAVVLSACGVGAQARPQTLDTGDVPRDLFTTSSTTTTTAAPRPAPLLVFFEGSQRLQPVLRVGSGPVTVAGALAQLAKGPTATEADQGLTSPVSSASPFTVARAAGGVVTVDIGSSFTSLAGQSEIVAAAQLVFTATAVPGVSAVIISVGGQQTQVPKADGSLSEGPLSRADYAPLAPAPGG